MLVGLLMGGMIYLSYMSRFGNEVADRENMSTLYVTYGVLILLCIVYEIIVK